MPSFHLSSILASCSFGLLFTIQVLAANPERRCYNFQIQDGPESRSIVSSDRSEVWCYQKLDHPIGAIFLFNADAEEVRPELSILIEADGLITHGSLSAGTMTVHRSHSKSFNPFNVPLQEPQNQNPVSAPEDSSRLNSSAQDVLDLLLNSPPASVEEWFPQEGHFQAEASATSLPWRGYWWPYKGFPMKNPMRKYDQFVSARSGANPGALAWEAKNHVYRRIWWEGHCNGWAAASLLRLQPTLAKTDPLTGVEFSVSDQKAILTSKDYCVTMAFFGNRNRGNATDNPRDIAPALFHKTLMYYIGQLGKPVAMDYHSDPVVDNHVVSGYSMNIQKDGNTLKVIADLTVHKYDGKILNEPGVAPKYTRTYKYTLNLDEAGNITGGSWTSANPDFLWVPLSPTVCPKGNPGIQEKWVEELIRL